jgi:hypothetical protein
MPEQQDDSQQEVEEMGFVLDPSVEPDPDYEPPSRETGLPEPDPTTSQHKLADGTVADIPRTFDPMHVDAGYHGQEWGEHSTPDHELHGKYETDLFVERSFRLGNDPDGEVVIRNVPVTVSVSHLESGPTGGPEFLLEWSDGMKVTVLDADTAVLYLTDSGAITVEPDATVGAD